MPSVLAFLVLMVVVASTSEAWSGEGDASVIYRRTGTLNSDGQRDEDTTVGSNIVRLSDGSDFAVGPEALEDPDGSTYQIQWEVSQDDEADPVRLSMTIRKTAATYLDDDAIVAEFRDEVPDATDDQIAGLLDRRSHGAELPEPHYFVDPRVDEWGMSAVEADTMPVVVVLTEQPEQRFPRVQGDLMDTDPVAALEQMEDRLIAIEDYQTVVAELQAPIVDEIVSTGGAATDAFWLVNALNVEATPATISALAEDERVLRIESVPELAENAVNYGAEIQDALQVTQFLDAGVDGENPSGKSAVMDIYVGIVDGTLDMNHQAFNDSSSSVSRLHDAWRYSGGSWSTVSSSATSSPSHGTEVTGQLLADLRDGQDSSYTTVADQRKRSGMTAESSFSFIEVGGGIIPAVQKATALDIDVGSMSISLTGSWCDNDASQVTEIDNAYLDGVFWIDAAGNDGHAGSSCLVATPANAAGCFTVGAYDHTATDLNASSIATYSARGGDAVDRPLIHLTAPGGRSSGLTEYNDTYTSSSVAGTSYAAPAVAGVVADFKEHMVAQQGSTFANAVGNLYATMLLYGDRKIESGTAIATTPIDELWGAGRLRARMYGAAGMDAPWRGGWCSWTLDDAEVATCNVNDDGAGGNPDVSSDVEWFNAALWWFEPNVGTGETPANISFKVCRTDDTPCYTTSGTAPQMKRLWLGNVVSGHPWELKVTGVNVTSSTNSSYYSGQQKRYVTAAYFYEDRDRDDADGPDASIQ